ncbi:MAG: ferrous iron transport protein B [Thermoprotei archaeon]|nr:ferrous iron transport protein B [Thermoprotei archaeon]
MMVKVALIGNPNVGKTVIFNNLTRGREHVGNWPGTTVEKRVGRGKHKSVTMEIVDLPGLYELTASSIAELIARDYIVKENPDVVVNVVDASNIERNLYLTLLLLELEANVIVALNMWDVAESRGYGIDVKTLSELLGVPCIPTIAPKKVGIEELKDEIVRATQKRRVGGRPISYGDDVEMFIGKIETIILRDARLSKYPARWLAIKALEGDERALKTIEELAGPETLSEILSIVAESRSVLGGDPEVVLAERRYNVIRVILERAVRKREVKLILTDVLDEVFLNKYLGIPIFLAIMWTVFYFVFEVSEPFMKLLNEGFIMLGKLAGETKTPLASLWADGICSGLGFVLQFIFPIIFLYIALAILEQSGYLPRAAFLMDRIMYNVGLGGRSFIPMLLGFGCNVPAIMATRVIKDERDRLATILVIPLMSCAARLPVYVLIAGALFPEYAGTVVFSMYMLGIILAILVSLLARKLVPGLKGKPAPLLLELPPYRVPTLTAVLSFAWRRALVFLERAGTVLFAGALILWFLAYFPWGVEPGSGDSYAGLIGNTLQPIFSPLGFDSKLVTALVFGFWAKEVVIEALGILYGVEGEEEIRSVIAASVSPLTGLAYMAFVLIYVPCIATVAAVKKETLSWRWAAFLVAYQLTLAYAVALIIARLGSLL